MGRDGEREGELVIIMYVCMYVRVILRGRGVYENVVVIKKNENGNGVTRNGRR